MDQNDYKPLATADNQMLDNFLTVILKVRTLPMLSTTWIFFLKIFGQVFLADSTSPVALIYYKMQKIVKESK